MISEIHDIFPNFTEKKIWKILITIKARYKTYGTIGISRLEASRFGTSERQMQYFIDYLRESEAIRKLTMVKCKNNAFKCNVYTLSEWFIAGLNEVKDFIKKEFKYINPVTYVKSKFTIKKEGSKLKFKVNGNRYIIHTRGKFKNVIYDVGNNCITNPTTLG